MYFYVIALNTIMTSLPEGKYTHDLHILTQQAVEEAGTR